MSRIYQAPTNATQDFQHTDNEIQQLHWQRAVALQRQNETESAFASVPPEILASIAEFICLAPTAFQSLPVVTSNRIKPQLPPLALASISSYWREVMFATPSLWTELVIPEAKAKTIEANPKAATLLDMYLTHANPLPIKLDTPWDTHITEENSGRLRALVLRKPLASHDSLNLFTSAFDRLTTLTLDLRGTESNAIDLSTLPALQWVELSFVRQLPALPWRQIKGLTLTHSFESVAFDMLVRCEQLVKYSHTFPHFEGGEDWIQEEFVTLHHLESFECAFQDDVSQWHWSRSLPLVRLPAVKHITFWGLPHNDNARGHLSEFFSHLSPTLTSLHLHDWSNPSDIRQILSKATGLTRLRVNILDPAKMVDVLRVLSSAASPEASNAAEMLSPLLEDLEVVFHRLSHGFSLQKNDFTEQITSIAQRRCALRNLALYFCRGTESASVYVNEQAFARKGLTFQVFKGVMW
ncbi:hypothetical protein P691DRAFT_808744 [Macrolepiota fuliginosa MF-IS2]|uniref:F-box domain-containing protein n=1 Tax=Macrolepiota fuliginosa MF-IS2 TaxID=1400762 RepID=A0A9P5X3V9_9AGAR|nr:hypothetical protein P691DRAFT_808744 [Macrolepiota fuliginosa MF-IS2]